MKATDKGLADTAAGNADRQPSSGIATYARQSLTMAAQFSAEVELPNDVASALSAMAEAGTASHSIAGAAPALLEHGLIIQKAMPRLCPEVRVPDLSRHAG